MLVLTGVGRQRAKRGESLCPDFKRFLAREVHESIQDVIQVFIELVLIIARCDPILTVFGFLFSEDLVMSDQEGDRCGTFSLDFVRNLSCSIHEGANHSF